MSSQKNEYKHKYYDRSLLNSIPIEDICYQIGLSVKHNGSRKWVNLRNEKTVSAIINTDSNTIYDFGDPYIFGTGKNGGAKAGKPIDLIKYIYSCDFPEACERLADMYNIEPVNRNKNNKVNGLSYKEYSQIGVRGDIVSKNFDFDPEYPPQKLFDLADAYSMSVNELKNSKKEEHKEIYENFILNKKALPYIQELRNHYYISIWEQYSFLKDVDALELFDTVCAKSEFVEMYEKIIKSEKIFNKAAEGTKVKKIPKIDYSPDRIMNDILEKRLKPELGSHSYNQLKALAKEKNCSVKYEIIEPEMYYLAKEQIEDFPFRMFLKGNQMILGYLSKDAENINIALGRSSTIDKVVKKSLDEMIDEAGSHQLDYSQKTFDIQLEK